MKEIYDQGVSFRTFILNQETADRGKFMKYYIPMDIKEEIRDRVNQIDKEVHILGVVEGWCPDCHINLSILEKLISTNPNIKLKLITKSDAASNFEKYYENGGLRVPTFIFLDDNFFPKAAFIEKPTMLKGYNIDTLEGAKMQMSYIAGKLVEETALELLELLEKTA